MSSFVWKKTLVEYIYIHPWHKCIYLNKEQFPRLTRKNVTKKWRLYNFTKFSKCSFNIYLQNLSSLPNHRKYVLLKWMFSYYFSQTKESANILEVLCGGGCKTMCPADKANLIFSWIWQFIAFSPLTSHYTFFI